MKRLTAILLSLCMVLALAGCSTASGETTEAAAAGTEATTEAAQEA